MRIPGLRWLRNCCTFSLASSGRKALTLLQCKKQPVTLHKNYGDILPFVCSPGQLNQVFFNLLRNAFEAINEEGNIWINTFMDNGYAVIQIQDDGCGIPQANLSKIFDPFFTTKPIGSGTGLGLSLSYGIIEQHGGSIAVKSEIGKGTMFTVTLPITREADIKESELQNLK